MTMVEKSVWKAVVSDGLFLALILFLLAYPLYGVIAQEQSWPGPGQNSPEISAYQISIFAQESAQVIVVLVFLGYVLIRKKSPFLQTAGVIVFGYGLYSVIRTAVLSPQYPFMTYGFGEMMGGVLVLLLLLVSRKLQPTLPNKPSSKSFTNAKR